MLKEAQNKIVISLKLFSCMRVIRQLNFMENRLN